MHTASGARPRGPARAQRGAWQIGVSALQRQAIAADPKYRAGRYAADDPPKAGLAVARQIAMVSYRTHNAYETKFGRRLAGCEAAQTVLGTLRAAVSRRALVHCVGSVNSCSRETVLAVRKGLAHTPQVLVGGGVAAKLEDLRAVGEVRHELG